jgi:hypothetical protein
MGKKLPEYWTIDVKSSLGAVVAHVMITDLTLLGDVESPGWPIIRDLITGQVAEWLRLIPPREVV